MADPTLPPDQPAIAALRTDLSDPLHDWTMARLDRKCDRIDALLADIRTTLAASNDKLAV